MRSWIAGQEVYREGGKKVKKYTRQVKSEAVQISPTNSWKAVTLSSARYCCVTYIVVKEHDGS